MNNEDRAELYNLYHLARTALADKSPSMQTKYERKLWAIKEFEKAHPGKYSAKIVYLEFERCAT